VSPWGRGLLVAATVAAVVLRTTGWDRGLSDFVLSEAETPGRTTSFYQFHPDESTLISASLALDDPTQPPLTAYGTLPMYLGRAVLETVAVVTGNELAHTTEGGRGLAVISLRFVSMLLSLATLVAMWRLANTVWGEATALAAVLLVAATPLAIQQAHFYTVDGLFALLALMSLAAVVRADGCRSSWAYMVAGLLIGATAATRLNGLLTALVLAAAHFTASPLPGWRRVTGGLRSPGIWYAALATVITVIVLQPHLVLNPESMLQSTGTDDFAYSVAIARGEVLRPWSLADTDTIPYLHFWTALWPRGGGWPLTLMLAAGWLWAVVRGERTDRLIALWCALYFLTIGGLHTKHVRYLLPLLAPLGLLAGHMVIDLWERRWRSRWVVVGVTAAVLYTWTYGAAFAGIYRTEDARITAGRWIHEHVSPGASVTVERGGFSMRGSFSASVYQEHDLNTTTVFATRGYLTCGAAARYMAGRLADADWMVITDVNRYRQFTAAPDLYPVLASFYTALLDGDLGLQPVQRFKVYPRLAGWAFDDDDAEPSFLGFDHPAVHVLRQGADHDSALKAWREQASGLSGCDDARYHAGVQAMQAEDLEGAEAALADAGTSGPGLVHLLRVMIHERRGDAARSRIAMQSYSAGIYDRSLSAVLLPWATASSLIDLGMLSEAVRILELGWERRSGLKAGDLEVMSKSYLHAGRQLREEGRQDMEERAYLMAADLWESPMTLNRAAKLVSERGAAKLALSLWDRSLRLHDEQVNVHRAAAVDAERFGQHDRAIHHLDRVVGLTLTEGARGNLDTAVETARHLLRLGEGDRAESYLRDMAHRSPEWEDRLQAVSNESR